MNAVLTNNLARFAGVILAGAFKGGIAPTEKRVFGGLRRLIVGATAVLGLMVSAHAPAWSSLIGDSVTGCVRSTASGDCAQSNFFVFLPPAPPIPLPTATVGAGVEFSTSTRSADFDGAANTLTLGWTVTLATVGFGPDIWEFGDLEWRDAGGALIPGGISSVTLGLNNLPVTPTISSGPNFINITVPNFILSSLGTVSRFATFNFTADHGPSLPEPATLALFGAGLAGLGLMRRRRRTV